MKSLSESKNKFPFMKNFFLSLFVFFAFTCVALSQQIEKSWITTSSSNSNHLHLNNGDFNLLITELDSKSSKGSYIHQNSNLIFYFNNPPDSISKYKILKLTDSTLILKNKSEIYRFISKKIEKEKVNDNPIIEDTIKPSQGFTFNSFLRGALGMIVLLFIAFIFSSNRKAINWKTVGIGLGFQLLLAIGILKITFIRSIFNVLGKGFNKVLTFTEAGTKFLFSSFTTNEIESPLVTFAIMILPTIIFFSALTSVLFYLGIIQKVVKALAWLLSKFLKISGAESLSVAGNIFLGQTESPLLIKAYLEKMNKSEILLVMIGGMATVAGGVLAAYIGFLGGNDQALRLEFARHLLAASVMAAPGAIIISKILLPQTEEVNTDVTVSKEKIGSNILDAMATGTTDGLKLAANVAAMLLVFVAFIAMINYGFLKIGSIGGINSWVASNTPYDTLSLEFILGYAFAPLMWLIGIAKEDIALMGQLLGIKLAASEFVGYIQLADLKNTANTIHFTFNKSIIMATYMLCGFANFASIGIQIGGIGSLAPGQRKTLSELGLKAVLGGTIASLLSATIAGMIIG